MLFEDYLIQETLSKEQYNKFREKLSSHEHDQWSHWTKYMLKHLTEKDFAQWRRQIKTPYNKLNQKEKDGDREWADKAIKIMKQFIKDL